MAEVYKSKKLSYWKMREFILFFFIFSSLSFYGKEGIDGVYVMSEYADTIIISSNNFIYKEKKEIDTPVFYEDTIAVCRIIKVDKYIYEINSNYRYSIIPATKIVCKHMNINNDSIRIHFQLPYSKKKNELTILIHFQNDWRYESVECNEDRIVFIPQSIKRFHFSIAPTFYDTRVLDGRYYGLLFYSSPDYDIAPDCNDVEVSIPVLNDGFFERYYPKNEYLYIKGNEIHWKGKIFKKIKTRQKWM